MKDPFSALQASLRTVFHLETKRNGKYTYNEVQHLKKSIDHYEAESSKTNFITLSKAIKESLPYIKKWRVDFESIKNALDALAQEHGLPKPSWNNPKISLTFQFSVLNHSARSGSLLVWITAKSGKPYSQLHHSELTQTLVDHRDHLGFSQKLLEHLKKDPEFLFNLIMQSEKNFIKVSHTRLILYLTDEQLAQAIIKHTPALTQQHKAPDEQVADFIEKLNEILSNGRSVSTLLRNTNAKAILDNSELFQIYQSDEYQNGSLKATEYPFQQEEAQLELKM